ncbi:hypothetical protein QFZ99_007195 [Paraburkholderia atlantica]
MPPRAARSGATARREDRDDFARVLAEPSARRKLPAAAAPGRSDAAAGRTAADDDERARTAKRRVERAADREPRRVLRPHRSGLSASGRCDRTVAERQRGRQRAGCGQGPATGRRSDDGRSLARDRRVARRGDSGRAAPARRHVERLRGDQRERRRDLQQRARRTSAGERRVGRATARFGRTRCRSV